MAFLYPNLLRGTADLSGCYYPTDKISVADDPGLGFAVARLTPTTTTGGLVFDSQDVPESERVSGAAFCLSFIARADVAGDRIHSEVWGSRYMLDTTLGTGWRLVTMPYGFVSPKYTQVFFNGVAGNSGAVYLALPMANRGAEPAAWAPAEGETLAGGGALMSDNLLEGVTPKLLNGTTATADGFSTPERTSTTGHDDYLGYAVSTERFESNQTIHVGVSVYAGGDGKLGCILRYKDDAGHYNYATAQAACSKGWKRLEYNIVVPSGMTVDMVAFSKFGAQPAMTLREPSCNLGQYGVTIAVEAHTAYATHAALKVQEDRITTEVGARAKTDTTVANLSTKIDQTATSLSTEVEARKQTDSNLSALSTKVTQTESSITTEISDRKQAVSAAQTAAINSANSATDAKLGSYTKTADLASTAAVKDAKKAGTDAAATANATATLIRQYSNGVLVCKTGNSVGALVNADGSFDVVPIAWSGSTPKADSPIASFQGDNVSFFGGMSEVPTTSISNDGVYVDSNGGICVGANAAIFGEKFGYDDVYGGKYRFAVYDDGIYSRGRKVPALKVLYDNAACTQIGSVSSSVFDASTGKYIVGDYSWADFVVIVAGKGETNNFGSVVLPNIDGISGSIVTENYVSGINQLAFMTLWLHKSNYFSLSYNDTGFANVNANGSVEGGKGPVEGNKWVIRQVIGVKL